VELGPVNQYDGQFWPNTITRPATDGSGLQAPGGFEPTWPYRYG
jgi:hypothetical protein